jgi:hypothetical protein
VSITVPHDGLGFSPPASRQGSILPANVGSPLSFTGEHVGRERSRLHPGLAFALVCLTFGLYTFYWLCQTWREIKLEDGDTGKRPFWHALAMFVPIYNLFRMHAHMRTIVELVQSYGGRTSLSPRTAVVVWMVVGALINVSDRPGLGFLCFVGLAIEGALVAWGQAALNQAWYRRDPQAPIRRTHPGYWVTLGVGVVLTLSALLAGLGP